MFHSLGPLTANELSYSVWLLDELDRERDGMMARVPCLDVVNVNVNVNVISRTALIRNRVSRRVCTCACHVWVSSIYFKRPKPISFPS